MSIIDTLPKKVETLDSVPAEYQTAYIADDDGSGYWLAIDVAKAIEDGEAELARLKSDHTARMAAADKEIAASQEQRRKNAISLAICEALTEASVDAKWHSAIAALLADQHRMHVEDNGFGPVVVADTPMGLKSAQQVVAEFLASDEASAYRPRSSAPEAGYFSSLLADLKRAR